jgi:FAD/FMN-containing dehydrogenase/Fe-S oxidoreductase
VGVSTLAADLRHVVAGEVHLNTAGRALYATDASNYRHVPVGVVIPRDEADVAGVLQTAATHGAAVLGRGSGTSLAGQTCNAAVVIDFSKYMRHIIDVDARGRRARVQPGVVLDTLRAATRPHGLTFGPDPATHQYCTLGGMIGNNSCGVHSVMATHYGPGPTTAHSVESLSIITADGTRMTVGATDEATYQRALAAGGRRAGIMRQLRAFQQRHADLIRREFPDIPRRVSGYNLPALLPENGFHVGRALVGSESTLALVLDAAVSLIDARPCRALVVAGFDNVFRAADEVVWVREYRPTACEGLDRGLVDDMRRSGLDTSHLDLLPDGDGWLLIEFGDTTQQGADEQARAFVAAVQDTRRAQATRLYSDPERQQRLWDIREAGLAATARVASRHPTWPGWEDSAVPPAALGAYLRDLAALINAHDYRADLYGHFGDGCVHCRINFDLRSEAGVAQFRRFTEAATDLVCRHGGSMSGEHGDGQARSELLPRLFSPAMMRAFKEFKDIWDPDHRMNPGRIVDAAPLDADLRLGPDYAPSGQSTWFGYPDDLGSFSQATQRCVGVGKCRKPDTGTMCPSYMATREEAHTTRGRAHLLFELLRHEGSPADLASHEAATADALDLCLACKGCKGECPVHVDMATYKAEFRAQYYTRHFRPRAAHAFGRIGTWARLVARLRAAPIVNAAARTPGLSSVMKAIAGMAQARAIPRFAHTTFSAERGRHGRSPTGSPRVLLWPDTFNDHFHPGTLHTAADALGALGFAVDLPPTGLCCGRPLYDFGLLSQARHRLTTILETMRDDIRAGTPIVGLEPSCVSVFRDELTNLMPESDDARRLSTQMFTFAEWLDRHADRLDGAHLPRSALVHGHCHHKAIMTTDADRRVMERIGLRTEVLDAGCCGMAGAFGFEHSHYDISMAIGERVLLPAVRAARADTLVVADGFSCREQIAQGTTRRAVHLAEIVAMAIGQRDGAKADAVDA